MSMTTSAADQETLRRIAEYATLAGWFWIILGIVQCLSIVLFYIFGPVVGIWNIVAGISRLGMVKRIKQRDPSVVAAYEGIAGLIIIGIINLVLGGIIGILFVAFDFIIRDKILSNRHLFTGG
ncbi:MAG: hypothetical protein HC876_18190 [Chloroflexaceae bacterium]|nr:hypothetical protein [Chloroflexaceae bacterium]NJO07282.1 hypothetical protein [Chloroflexaceae bacterium]